MKGCFENIDQAVEYIKYISLDNLNVSVKLYRENGCWYVEGLSLSEISEITGIDRDKVYARIILGQRLESLK